MTDVVTPSQRSRMMSGIRGKDTKPELIVRKGLHARGFRFRLHEKTLPGKPDLVFPKYRAAVFVNGCFWHGHHCHLFKWPETRPDFWREKIARNQVNDSTSLDVLRLAEWRVGIIWECALKGKRPELVQAVIARVARWLNSDREFLEVDDVEPYEDSF